MTFEQWWAKNYGRFMTHGSVAPHLDRSADSLRLAVAGCWNAAIDEAQKHTSNGLAPLKVKP
jgi:hypothetical protein